MGLAFVHFSKFRFMKIMKKPASVIIICLLYLYLLALDLYHSMSVKMSDPGPHTMINPEPFVACASLRLVLLFSRAIALQIHIYMDPHFVSCYIVLFKSEFYLSSICAWIIKALFFVKHAFVVFFPRVQYDILPQTWRTAFLLVYFAAHRKLNLISVHSPGLVNTLNIH